MKNFFSRPLEFSFKDFLAILFTICFLYFSFLATQKKEALSVIQTLVPLLGIILGGYFAQETATLWVNRTQEAKEDKGKERV